MSRPQTNHKTYILEDDCKKKRCVAQGGERLYFGGILPTLFNFVLDVRILNSVANEANGDHGMNKRHGAVSLEVGLVVPIIKSVE